MKVVCWFSCGAASACAAKMAIEKYGKENVRIVNNPIANEHCDNLRFLADCEKWLGVKIESVINPCYPDCDIEKVFDTYGMMSNANGFAPCTLELKQLARRQWESDNMFDKTKDIIIFGFTVEEKKRQKGFHWKKDKKTKQLVEVPQNKGYVLECPLIDNDWTKHRCFDYLESIGLKLPIPYTEMEMPNANCIGCVKMGSVWGWNNLRKKDPETFARRAEQSRRLGCRLVDLGENQKDKDGNEIPNSRHIFLDELDPNLKGRKPKQCYIECGIFCGLKN